MLLFLQRNQVSGLIQQQLTRWPHSPLYVGCNSCYGWQIIITVCSSLFLKYVHLTAPLTDLLCNHQGLRKQKNLAKLPLQPQNQEHCNMIVEALDASPILKLFEPAYPSWVALALGRRLEQVWGTV